MKSAGKNYLRVVLVLLLSCGLIYAFSNVVTMKMQGRTNKKYLKEVSSLVLKSVSEADRLACNTLVCVEVEDEYLQDKTKDMSMIQDFAHDRMLVSKGNSNVIFEYNDNDLHIYSKGISPIYNKDSVSLEKVALNQWYKYTTEKMFGAKQRKGENARLSYGFLKNLDYLIGIKKEEPEIINEKQYTKYEVELRNTLKSSEEEESDNEFRKTLNAHGVDIFKLKKDYPDIYKKMKKHFNADTEKMYLWLDEAGNLTKIQKDYTFTYYLEIMNENSEKIYSKVGQYGYPEVSCFQEYSYNPTCKRIELPLDFKEL